MMTNPSLIRLRDLLRALANDPEQNLIAWISRADALLTELEEEQKSKQ
jgi:hypothetical protein